MKGFSKKLNKSLGTLMAWSSQMSMSGTRTYWKNTTQWANAWEGDKQHTIDNSLIENNFEVSLRLLTQTCQWFNLNDISLKLHSCNHNKVWPSKPIIVVKMDGCKKLHLRSTTKKYKRNLKFTNWYLSFIDVEQI
jgi:hypothetical protein